MKNEVDPNRFTSKEFSRRKAFPDSIDDFSIRIDGLTAGRVMKMKGGYQRVYWLWSLNGPYYPHNQPHNGEAETFESAREAFKKLFWQWHAWALKQNGPVTWYGADK